MSCECCCEKTIETKKEQYLKEEISKEDYLTFIKNTVLKQVISLEFDKDSIHTLDEMRCNLFEAYFLIGSGVLGMDIEEFEFMSCVFDMMSD